MKPVLYRYRDTESVIKVMDGYTPGEGWEPLYSQDQISSAVNAALKATAPDERVKELEAELAAAEIAIAEYRQQCLDNAAEIARLRSESEERLQNCAALVAEVERLRAAPATAPEPVAWLAHYVGRSGMGQEYVSTDKNLADENDASGKALPLYLHPPATAPDDRHAQELLAQDITLQNMAERHAQELCAYELTVQNLLAERKPMTDDETLALFDRVKVRMLFTDAEAAPFASGVAAAEHFHGIGDKT